MFRYTRDDLKAGWSEAGASVDADGYPAVVHVGVTRAEGAGNAFQAHAWLESDGKVIIGESEVPYVPLTTLSETAGV